MKKKHITILAILIIAIILVYYYAFFGKVSCETIKDINERDSCYSDLAIDTQDESICEYILEGDRNECKTQVYLEIGDFLNCEKFEERSEGDPCREAMLERYPDKLYESVLAKIKGGNQWVIENDADDQCFPYRYYNKGCYYSPERKMPTLAGTLAYEGLTHEEVISLCYEFAHKGGTAFCLMGNKEIDKCLDFAENNSYLQRICNLEEGETIPTVGFYDPQYQENPIDYMKYSELL